MWGDGEEKEALIALKEKYALSTVFFNGYTNEVIKSVDYEVKVEQNTPLPEDEIEEKNMDIVEVESKTMSRKAYMKKWRGLTDDEVKEELEQIAFEREILEDISIGGVTDEPPYPEMEE